jgi:hypothetical protein
MGNISTAVRGHYDNDRYIWTIIIRRFCDNQPPAELGRQRGGGSVGRCSKSVPGRPDLAADCQEMPETEGRKHVAVGVIVVSSEVGTLDPLMEEPDPPPGCLDQPELGKTWGGHRSCC